MDSVKVLLTCIEKVSRQTANLDSMWLPTTATYPRRISTQTLEKFFRNGFVHMPKLDIGRGGPWEEMEGLKAAMLGQSDFQVD